MGKDKKQKVSMAEQADRHALYQMAVQDPGMEIELLNEKYSEIRGRAPLSFREDFCGTAYLSVEWCKSDPRRTAVGIDLDEETLAWGRTHNVEAAGPEVTERVQLIHGDVLDSQAEPVDLLCAFNFSYNGFKRREDLVHYFRMARKGLNSDGVMVMDVYGGTEALEELDEDREVEEGDFTYIWEQAKFNPITHDTTCHIHFEFPDGSRMNRAFTYQWRLWMLPELREALYEAGFSKVRVYWEEFEDEDEDSDYLEGTGNYYEATEVENQESWICYVFAEV